jgi:hypothetical protein
MLKSIRILLIVVYHVYEIWKMDVKIAFFNGNLHGDVYMTQLKVLNLKKIQWSIQAIKNHLWT